MFSAKRQAYSLTLQHAFTEGGSDLGGFVRRVYVRPSGSDDDCKGIEKRAGLDSGPRWNDSRTAQYKHQRVTIKQ